MQQPGGQTWNGGEQMSNGGAGTTGPPADDGPDSSPTELSIPPLFGFVG